jgi:GH15 family glucan-1,4-alpha-glucosidase
LLEEKPASIAFHYRNAEPSKATEALKEIKNKISKKKGVFTKEGKMVLEFTVVKMSKGDALKRMRHRMGAHAVVFIGDDITDEDAFKMLSGPDLSIKVGDGKTSAHHRVKDTSEVAHVMARLCELRCKWLEGAGTHPIEQYSYLTDQRSTALVSPKGSISWLCMPRIDSNSFFSELVGGPSAGYFSVKPTTETNPKKQYYKEHSLQLVTEWEKIKVLDYLDVSGGRTNQRAGRSDLIRVIEGSGEIEVQFAPRVDFGRMPTRIEIVEGGLQIESTLDPIVLKSPGVKWKLEEKGQHHTAIATLKVSPKKPITLELRYGTANLSEMTTTEEDRRKQTHEYWKNWVSMLQVPDKIPPEVKKHILQSALVLKGLCYGPSGGIAAAATTSLPEHVGGVRNWDYRFTWLRDGALSALSLVRLGSTHEAMHFLDWVLHVLDRCLSPERLRPLYTVTGHEIPPEASIGELAGYGGSRPVRIGNAAAYQVQLDVFGPVVELIWRLSEVGAPLSSEHWRLVEAMVLAVEKRWKDPDNGIWEIRGAKKHHVHSKLMCWLTVDRALELSEKMIRSRNKDWEKLAQEIKKDLLKNGWHPEAKAFTISYDSEELDAANLLLGLTGMLRPDDKKFISTVKAVEKTLLEKNTVYRYRCDDSLPGTEGGFHLCTAWLIQAYAYIGEKEKAKNLFNELLKMVGPTGLLPEEVQPHDKTGLGNHPQAYSHLGLINAALKIYS